MGIQKKVFKKGNMDEDAFELIQKIKIDHFGDDKTKEMLFEIECKAMGFESKEPSKSCHIF